MGAPVQPAGAGLKSIQRGVINTSNVSSGTATISAVNMSRSRLIFHGCTALDGSGFPLTAAISFTNSTTIAGAFSNASSGAGQIRFEVEEDY